MNKYIYIICVALMLLLSNCRNVDKNFLPVEDNYFLQHISLGMTQKEYAKYAVDSVKINGYCFEVRPGFVHIPEHTRSAFRLCSQHH